jgi:hypothetical protein
MRVYIAGPYTLGDVNENVANAIRAGQRVLEAGHTPFIPHLNHFWHCIHPAPASQWLAWDNEWLVLCDALIRLPGKSVGSDAEVKLAKATGLAVYKGLADFLNYHDLTNPC